ncbi:MAG: hypothetical protein ACI3V0_02500 [Faecousia sp.]
MSCNGNCGSCTGCGGSCGGCARSLVITRQELAFLKELGQVAFLPVARRMGDLEPVYLEAGQARKEEYSLLLQCLEKKGLISLDYDKPLGGFDDSAYAPYPIRGSMGLTERGQKVLEMLEYQGISEENE